jgi:hypothetical protein
MGEPGQTPYAVIKPVEWNGTLVLDLDFNGWNAVQKEWFLGHCFAIGGPAASMQATAGAAPDPNVREILVNGRVSVREVTWRHGTLRPTNHFQDSITVFLQGGRMRIVKLDGATTTVTRKTGDVVAESRGGDADHRDAVDAPVRAIVIDLHDNVVPGIANESGYPDAFPRPGAKKVLETARVLVWDYTFVENQPSPMHFHPRDVVTIYTEEGAVTATTPQGVQTVNNHHPGEVVFNQRNRAHTEQLSRGNVHIIAVELK